MILPAATTSGSALWYLSRGTGVVSLLLFTAVMVLGLLGPLRVTIGARWPRFALDTLHRDVSLLAVALLVVHIITSVLDGFAPIDLTDAIVPLGSSYRPLWLGLGALALDIVLALVITSLVRRRLGLRVWRALHWLAYLSWPVAVLHGLGTGSDTKLWWMLALTAVCVIAVLIALSLRISSSASVPRARTGALAAAGAVVAGIALFTLVGPLQRGWARRAGTPAALLPGARSFAGPVRGHALSVSAVPLPFLAQASGSIRRRATPGGQVLDLDLRLSGGAVGVLRVRVARAARGDGRLALTGSQVDLVVTGLPGPMTGRLRTLQDGPELLASVRDPAGGAFLLHVRLRTDGPSASGTVRVSEAARGG